MIRLNLIVIYTTKDVNNSINNLFTYYLHYINNYVTLLTQTIEVN
jgi:hypothetical protein